MAPDLLAARGLKRAFQQNAFFHDLTLLENMAAVLQDRHGTATPAPGLMPVAAPLYPPNGV